jgi:cell fate regulator YaaT (PSP1 superfamily)
MAKNQKSTLDPNKISGRCSRLKCCLRHEDDTYTELRECLPRVGKMVDTSAGEGKVLSVDVLAGTVMVILSSRERRVFSARELCPEDGACHRKP